MGHFWMSLKGGFFTNLAGMLFQVLGLQNFLIATAAIERRIFERRRSRRRRWWYGRHDRSRKCQEMILYLHFVRYTPASTLVIQQNNKPNTHGGKKASAFVSLRSFALNLYWEAHWNNSKTRTADNGGMWQENSVGWQYRKYGDV